MSEDEGNRVIDLRERAVLALTTAPAESLSGLLQGIISLRRPLEDKYREVDVTSVLQENVAAVVSDRLSDIGRACNILEKYGRNLLLTNKPKFWRAVKFNNPVFKTTVDGIQGGRAILRLYGYTVEQSDGMSFPEDVQEPDQRKVAFVTMEVAMLQMELEQLRKGAHPHPELFSRFLPAGGLPARVGRQPESEEQAPSSSISDPQEASQTEATAVPLEDCCAVCSKEEVAVRCQSCCWLLCEECDALYHRHPSRGGHQRTPLWRARRSRAAMPPPSEGLAKPSSGSTTPLAGGSLPAVPSAATPSMAEEPKEAPRSTAKPGLGRRSLSADQQSCQPSRARPDRRPSDLATLSLPRSPWACASCRLVNEARAVLCGACDRPRASPAPVAGAGEGRGATPREGWCCRACTCQNEPTSVLCSACERPRLAGKPSFTTGSMADSLLASTPPLLLAATEQVAGWECQHCTFLNRHQGRICGVCDRTSTRDGQVPGAVSSPHPKIQRLEDRPGAVGGHRGAVPGAGGRGGAAADGDRAADRARQEDMRAAGLRLVHMIRVAEEQQVTPEEVFCALQCSGKDAPLEWLQAELPLVLETIADLASQKGEAMPENEVGPVTREEARQAWLASGGNFEEAVQECVRTRAKKFREIWAMGFTNQQEVLQALYMNGGDVDKAVIDLQCQLLEPFHAQIWQEDEVPIQLDQPDKQRILRQILATYNLPSWGRAEIVLSLMQEGRDHYQIHDVVEAVKESQDKEFIKRMLSLTCLVCLSLFPRSKMQSVTSCECTVCRDCFKEYFTFTVREKHIKNLVCPGCSKPDIDDEGQLLSYFSTLDVQLRDCLDVDVYNLFHKKLTERTLMKDPKFKWCTHCSNGFIYDGNQSKVTCPQCKGSFCVECKRPWEQQHQGISCEDFQNWKRENDPEYQAQGLAAYLKENGIDCPNCKFRYALAKGGCMHFRCSQCQHEFCSGCYNTFLGKKKCTDPVCLLKDTLHAHHPRDCLFYLRDWSVNRLQELLQSNKVNFDTDPPTGAEPTPGGLCRVMEQREVGDSLTDAPCGIKAHDGHAGLCESHYKEYLVSRINGHSLDPAQMFDEEEMQHHFRRRGKAQPPKAVGEDDSLYRNRLLQVISSVPLGDKIPRVRK